MYSILLYVPTDMKLNVYLFLLQFASPLCDENYNPSSIECRTKVNDSWIVFTNKDSHLAPDILHVPCTKGGLMCLNSDQPIGTICNNYNVRFFCTYKGII